MKNGACYIRVSTAGQEELSPDAQRRLLLEYAEKNDIFISKDYIFIENGISGRHANKRPEFQRMISAAKSEERPFDMILVWKYSRFARNQEESIVYKSLLKKQCNVDVISISEPLIDGPFGSLIERIIEWMDEYYSIRLSGEVMRGMQEKARRGGYQAAIPLGYQYNGPGTIPSVIEAEASIIRYIFQAYAEQGLDRTAIARRLNDSGKRTKRGNLYEKRNIEYVLKNPFYIGKIRWNRAPHSSYRENPEDEIIIADGAHEPIIAQELFERANARLRSESRTAKSRSVSACRHWLSGLVRCSVCGASLSYSRPAGGFQCWKYARGVHGESCYISSAKLEVSVIRGLEEFLSGKKFAYEYRAPSLPDAGIRTGSLQKELGRIASREERVKLAYENGIDTLEEYRSNRLRLQKERERLQDELRKEIERAPAARKPGREEILRQIQDVYNVVSDGSVDQETKGNLMRELFGDIAYDRKNDILTFRITISQNI